MGVAAAELRRGRAIHEVYGFDEPGQLRRAALSVWGLVGADLRWVRSHAAGAGHRDRSVSLIATSARHHLLRAAGAMLGVRAERLPAAVVRRLSLEGRR